MDPSRAGFTASHHNNSHCGSDGQDPIVIYDSDDDDGANGATGSTAVTPSVAVSASNAFKIGNNPRDMFAGSQLAFMAGGIRCFVSGPDVPMPIAGRGTVSSTSTGTNLPNPFLAAQSPASVAVPSSHGLHSNSSSVSQLAGSQLKMDAGRAAMLAFGPLPSSDGTPPPDGISHGRTGGNNVPLGTRNRGSHQEAAVPKLGGGGRAGIAVNSTAPTWDFNSNDPLPGCPPRVPRNIQIREFARCNDNALLDYLANRRVSIGFLVEIDQFLRCYGSTIEKYSPEFIQLMSSLAPLDAYLYFVKGYTRPARYVDGLLGPLTLPRNFIPVSIRKMHDQELDDFFAGFDYRYDILDRIDCEVRWACEEICRGHSLSIRPELKRLVSYAIYGNPVDAYKWYEYNYQLDYMPHRYLPEHVVLGDVPKPQNYTEPAPTKLLGWRGYRDIRERMARAKDQGVDVIDVLMKEYRTALVKKGLRRPVIDALCTQAQSRIDGERANPTGVDIVDMIMDEATNTKRVDRPLARGPPARPNGVKPDPMNGGPPTRPSGPASRRPVGKPSRRGARARVLTPVAKALCLARSVLLTCYKDEIDVLQNTSGHSLEYAKMVQKARGVAERKYVQTLIQYGRDTKRMLPEEASDLQRTFTKARMVGLGPVYKDFLLSVFPVELK